RAPPTRLDRALTGKTLAPSVLPDRIRTGLDGPPFPWVVPWLDPPSAVPLPSNPYPPPLDVYDARSSASTCRGQCVGSPCTHCTHADVAAVELSAELPGACKPSPAPAEALVQILPSNVNGTWMMACPAEDCPCR